MGKKFISSIVLDSDNVTVGSVKDAHIIMCKMLMEEPVGTEMMTLLASANGGASATVLLKYTRRADVDGSAIISHDFINSVKLKQFGISWNDIRKEPKDVSLKEKKAVEYARSKCPFSWSQCDGCDCSECVFDGVQKTMARDFMAGWDEAMKQKSE